MLLFAVQHHGVGFFLPTLLQCFDRINAQGGCSTQGLRLCDQALTTRQAGFLHDFQGFVGGVNGGFPDGLQLGKHLFTEVTTVAPALGKLVQLTRHAFPIRAICMGNSPGFDFFNQGQALCFVRRGLGARFLQPCIHHLVGAVTSGIKALPQRGIGRGFFVDFFPLLAQATQRFLHLATAHGGDANYRISFGSGGIRGWLSGSGRLNRHGRLGWCSCGGRYRCVRHHHNSFHIRRDNWGSIRDWRSLCYFRRSLRNFRRSSLGGFGNRCGLKQSLRLRDQLKTLLIHHRFVSRGFDFARGIHASRRLGCGHGGSCLRQHLAPRHSDLVSPCGHSWQGRSGISGGGLRQGQGFTKGCPYRLHLLGAGLQCRRKLGIHAGPLGVGRQGIGLCHPAVQICLQGLTLGQGLLPRFG